MSSRPDDPAMPPEDDPSTAADDRLLRTIFENIDEGVALVGPDLRLRAMNRRFVEASGLDPALARPGTEVLRLLQTQADAGHLGDGDAAAAVRRWMRELGAGGSWTRRRTLPDGRTLDLRRSPTPDGGFVATVRDVSDQVAAESALAEQRGMLGLLLETTSQGFWFVDAALVTTDVNPAVCRMLGMRRDELIGRSLLDFVYPEEAAVLNRHAAALLDEDLGPTEVRLRRADGSSVWCMRHGTPIRDAAGRRTGWVGMLTDIGELRDAHALQQATSRQLQHKSRVLEATLKGLPQGVLTLDAEGRAAAWNARLTELAGLPDALLRERPTLAEIVRWQIANGDLGPAPGEIDPANRRSVEVALSGDLTRLPPPYRRVRGDGRTLLIETRRSADGLVVRTFTDITETLRAEAALVAARDRAERASRAKSDFLSRVSHELRTPLNAVLGFGQLLTTEGAEPLTPLQRERVDRMMRGGAQLLALVDEVLDLAGLDAGELAFDVAPVDPAAALDAALRRVAPLAREREVAVGAERAPAQRRIRADASRLEQVLSALLTNAVKFNRRGGRVEVRWRDGGPRLRIEIHDDGPGIDEADHPRVFEAFERTDDAAADGLGIGLALAKRLVDAMGGGIGLVSSPGAGSAFWVEFDRAEPAPAAARVAAAARRTLLYVEDNAVNQVVMQAMLARRPAFELVLADTASAGLALAAARRPDLVLADIHLPDADGFELLRRLRAHEATGGVPVIAVSADATPQQIAAARAAGFDDYLTKPVDHRRLLDTIDRILAAPGY